MKNTVSVIRKGEKCISEVDAMSIQAGDIFFTDSVHSRKLIHYAAGSPYAYMVCDADNGHWWHCDNLLSELKPYVITTDNDPYNIPSAERMELNHITSRVLGMKAARAAAQADGIKFINDIPAIPKKVYIDTEENRRVISSYLQNLNRIPGFPNMVVYNDGKYISDISFWGAGVFGELWDPHKKTYIQKESLPEPLLKACENLWQCSGDDYLVEYSGKFYYMLDHAYYTESAKDYGSSKMSELFDIALENAKTAAMHDELKDCLVLVSKDCKENGGVHFVSILIDAEASKDKVDGIKNVLSKCMFKKPERAPNESLDFQIKSASARVDSSHSTSNDKEKEISPEI